MKATETESKALNRFKFTVYSPRWGHNDTYRLGVLDDGWYVAHLMINGNCDKQGEPFLFRNFRQDSINYPSGLGFEMGLLFEHARDGTLPDNEIQRRLDLLGEWVGRVNSVEPPNFD